ncbi:6791_t:CDS:2, partial [Ambispora gerdemannii]
MTNRPWLSDTSRLQVLRTNVSFSEQLKIPRPIIDLSNIHNEKLRNVIIVGVREGKSFEDMTMALRMQVTDTGFNPLALEQNPPSAHPNWLPLQYIGPRPTNISTIELLQREADKLSWHVVDRATKTESALNITLLELVKILGDQPFASNQSSIASISYRINNSEIHKKRSNIHKRYIIGSDNRAPVYNSEVYPIRTVGYIASECTGTLIAPNVVLTAGHCLHDGTNWYKNLSVSPVQDGPVPNPIFGQINWAQAWTVKGWTEYKDKEYDYGLIILERDADDDWMSFGWNNQINEGWGFNIIEYPGDKAFTTMWWEYCPVNYTGELELEHFCDIVPRASGSGLYVYRPQDEARIIYSVQSHQAYSPSFP